jgi:hypothetical protein
MFCTSWGSWLADPDLWNLLLGFGLVWLIGLACAIWLELRR